VALQRHAEVVRAHRQGEFPGKQSRISVAEIPFPYASTARNVASHDGGIRFVPDQAEAAAEKLRLELRGYAVSQPTQAAALRLMAQTKEVLTDEAAETPFVRFLDR